MKSFTWPPFYSLVIILVVFPSICYGICPASDPNGGPYANFTVAYNGKVLEVTSTPVSVLDSALVYQCMQALSENSGPVTVAYVLSNAFTFIDGNKSGNEIPGCLTSSELGPWKMPAGYMCHDDPQWCNIGIDFKFIFKAQNAITVELPVCCSACPSPCSWPRKCF